MTNAGRSWGGEAPLRLSAGAALLLFADAKVEACIPSCGLASRGAWALELEVRALALRWAPGKSGTCALRPEPGAGSNGCSRSPTANPEEEPRLRASLLRRSPELLAASPSDAMALGAGRA